MTEDQKSLPALQQVQLKLDGSSLVLRDIDEVKRAATMFCISEMFAEKNQDQGVARACVKIIAGQELGLKPFQAMRGIDIFQGSISYKYQLVASKIKQSGRYDYTVLESNDKCAKIQFLDNGKPAFVSEYTIEQAARAGLTSKDVWKKHPEDMLFARAMSKGANKVCPEIFFGPVHTPEDFGFSSNEQAIDVDYSEEKSEPTVKEVATEIPKSNTRHRNSKPASGASKETNKSEQSAPTAQPAEQVDSQKSEWAAESQTNSDSNESSENSNHEDVVDVQAETVDPKSSTELSGHSNPQSSQPQEVSNPKPSETPPSTNAAPLAAPAQTPSAPASAPRRSLF